MVAGVNNAPGGAGRPVTAATVGRTGAALLPVLLLLGAGCRGATPPAPPVPIVEKLIQIPLEVDGRTLHLEASVFEVDRRVVKEAAPRGPLVILSHGSIPPEEARWRRRWRPVAQARWFVERGAVVAVPMRRGYAESEGRYAEGYGDCAAPDYLGAIEASARDLQATIAHLSRWPTVSDRVYLVGVSGGGLGALALPAGGPLPVAGAVVFGGVRGSTDGKVCREERLLEALRTLGRRGRPPTLWLHVANDSASSMALARRLFDAWAEGAPGARFVELPAFKAEGHYLLQDPDGVPVWSEAVGRFLGR